MQLKTCVVCKKELPISCFYKRKDSKDGHRNECKYCDKLNNKQYYKSHQQQILNHVAQYTEQNKEKIKQYQNEYRKSNAEKLKDCIIKRSINKRQKLDSYKTLCIKCGENRFYLIDFHHIDPSTKCFTIGNSYRCNDEKIKKEVSKCVCLCANCHREFHYFYGVVPNDPINQLAEYLDITTDFIDDIAVNTIQN